MPWKLVLVFCLSCLTAAPSAQAQGACAIEQLTFTTGDNAPFESSLSGDGTRLAVSAFGDFDTGGNPDRSLELFVVDSLLGQVTQITSGTSSQLLRSGNVSDDGRVAPFVSPLDLTGENPDGSLEIFLLLMATRKRNYLAQSTDATQSNPHSRPKRIIIPAAGGLWILQNQVVGGRNEGPGAV